MNGNLANAYRKLSQRDWYFRLSPEEANALRKEIERMRAIVDKLPTTADGQATVPGDEVYDPVDEMMHQVWCFSMHAGRWHAITSNRTLRLAECYTSRGAYRAAEAAKEPPQ